MRETEEQRLQQVEPAEGMEATMPEGSGDKRVEQQKRDKKRQKQRYKGLCQEWNTRLKFCSTSKTADLATLRVGGNPLLKNLVWAELEAERGHAEAPSLVLQRAAEHVII